jgi:superfamily II DNA helicase RecQ
VAEKVRESLVEAMAGGSLVKPPASQSIVPVVRRHPEPTLESLSHLRRTLNRQDALFRSSQQAIAYETIVNPTWNYLWNLPVSFGKTFLYILAALHLQNTGNKFILVVLPYKVLMIDVVDRAKKLGISAYTLDFSEGTSAATLIERTRSGLVVVSADLLCTSDTLQEYIRITRLGGRLHCMVLDEAQALLDRIRAYALRRLPEVIQSARVPFILCSGSLSHEDTRTLMNTFGTNSDRQIRPIAYIYASETGDPNILNLPNIRPNIAYSVHGFNKQEALLSGVLKAVEDIRKGSNKKERVLIYTRSTKICDDLASKLHGLPYHADHPEQDLMHNAKEFAEGNVDVLVATTAFGVGVDIPNVRHSIHVGPPFSLNNFVQESGRIGRDGAHAEARILYDVADLNTKKDDGISSFIRSQGRCLRAVISSSYDEMTHTCFSLSGASPCQNCRRSGAFSNVKGANNYRNSEWG